MRILWRVLLVLGTFLGAGYGAMHVVIARAVARGTPEYAVRLAGAMTGLFAGGVAAVLVCLGLLLTAKRGAAEREDAQP